MISIDRSVTYLELISGDIWVKHILEDNIEHRELDHYSDHWQQSQH